MQIPKNKPVRSKAYLSFVACHPCQSCGSIGGNIAHHVRTAKNSGIGTKPSDHDTICLCHSCHAEVHQHGYLEWDKKHQSQFDLLSKMKRKAIKAGFDVE